MLEYIRTNTQSLGVKLAFGIIILVFVFWGVGSMQNLGMPTSFAVVNGEPISVVDFEMALRQAQENVRRENPTISAEQIQSMQLPHQVLQGLIISTLLKQEAQSLNITATPLEIRRAIAQMPDFQNAEGAFDSELYKKVMSNPQMSISRFENLVREQLLEGKLRRDVTVTGMAFASETRDFYDFTYESRDIDYIFFSAEDMLATLAEPAEDSVKAYYESHRAQFTLPPKADVAYVLVRPTDIVKTDSIEPAKVQEYYAENIVQFTKPARAKVRHILLMLDAAAPEEDVKKAEERMAAILAELHAGADFAELATKYSEDTTSAANGGNLEWITPGASVPAFNDAVFAMKTGDVSDAPVRTDFGLHIIKVDDMQEAHVPSLEEVEPRIRQAVAEHAGLEGLNAVLDALIEANILGEDVAAVAAKHGLLLQETGLKSAQELEEFLSISSQNALKIINTSEGMPLDMALDVLPNADTSVSNSYMIVRVKAKQDAAVRPYEEVKADIVALLKEQSAVEAATAAAVEARKAMDTALPAELEQRVRSVKSIERAAPVGVLGNAPGLNQALFAADQHSWLAMPFTVTVDGKPGAALVRVTNISVSSDAQWEPMEQILIQVLSLQRQEAMFQLFMAALRESAEVEIVDEASFNNLFAQ